MALVPGYPAGGTVTVANGDELHLAITGETTDPGTGVMTTTYLVTGGTGRFQGASGVLTTYTVMLSWVDMTWENTLEGWIRY